MIGRGTGRATADLARYAQRETRDAVRLVRMDTVTPDPNLVAYCGLYCGACRAYLAGSCPGCRENTRGRWCRVRTCCISGGHATCAGCTSHLDPRHCAKFNNLISRVFGFVSRSNRAACIDRIDRIGRQGFAREMAAARRQTLPR